MDSAFTEGNGIDLTISSGTPSVDALKALVRIVEKFEEEVANGVTHTAVTAGNEIVVTETGNNPYHLHAYELQDTTDVDNQLYVVVYQGLV